MTAANKTGQPFRLGLMYDCRVRPGSELTMRDVYRAVVQQAALADKLGFDFIWFTEHHFVADGYLPAFQPVAGAVAAVTERIRISNDIALLPLYHPIRLAEELATERASRLHEIDHQRGAAGAPFGDLLGVQVDDLHALCAGELVGAGLDRCEPVPQFVVGFAGRLGEYGPVLRRQ